MTSSRASDSERLPLTRRQATAPDAVADASSADHPLITLQRQLGNAQVARMLAQREHAPEEEELQAKHDSALQREEAPEEEELQASPEVGLEGGPVSAGVADQIKAARGNGSALDDGMRGDMETSFGTSFEGVRVHDDPAAHQLSRNISAKAFTTGNDIFLGAGASASDRSLMAHELTHVVQQREMSSSGPMSVGPAGDSHEQEADTVAAAVVNNAAAPQRKSDDES